jgi:SAM-dependent methyltransferase
MGMESTELCKIMGECGSDKGHENISESKHNYTLLYYKLFAPIKDKKLRIFELGLGTNNPYLPSSMGVNGKPGASLYGWSKFFQNAHIFGADIDRDILFETERIRTYYCDQTNMHEIRKMWNNRELWEPFDIIVEDGLHEFDANVCFFENSIHKLKQNGYFIIEDIVYNTILRWEEKINEWRIIYPHLSFQLIRLPNLVNNYDNNLLVVHFNSMNRS